MPVEELCSKKVKESRVVVLEDHQGEREAIVAILQDIGISHIAPAKTVDEFLKLLNSNYYDVASIDWDIRGVFQGPQMLAYVCNHSPATARVVYTVHADERSRAISAGADVFLEKTADESSYREAISNGVRLGLARFIEQNIPEQFGVSICNGPLPCPIPSTIEEKICSSSRESMINSLLEGEKPSKLYESLVRRGWWREFDQDSYIQMSWRKRLLHLSSFLDMGIPELSPFLNSEVGILNDILLKSTNDNLDDNELLRSCDSLLSVFAYLLRLAQYEPELMLHYWNVKDLFQGSESPPPWDDQGLCSYLERNRSHGINKAINWIRRH